MNGKQPWPRVAGISFSLLLFGCGFSGPLNGRLQPKDFAGPSGPDFSASVRFGVLSDLNGSYGSTAYSGHVKNAVRQLLLEPPAAVLITGDMVAGQKSGLNYQGMWNAFHDTVTGPLTARGIPVFVTPGNHDASGYPGFEGERRIYGSNWKTRKPDRSFFVDDQDYPFNYAAKVNGVLLISLDVTLSPAERRLPADQLAWLATVLEAQHQDARGIILFSHFPVYPVARDREDDYIGDPRLIQLMRRYGVGIFLSGHHHAYFPGVLDDIYLTAVGCIGGGQRALIGTNTISPSSFVRFAVTGGRVEGIKALLGADPQKSVRHADLPASIKHGNFLLKRMP